MACLETPWYQVKMWIDKPRNNEPPLQVCKFCFRASSCLEYIHTWIKFNDQQACGWHFLELLKLQINSWDINKVCFFIHWCQKFWPVAVPSFFGPWSLLHTRGWVKITYWTNIICCGPWNCIKAHISTQNASRISRCFYRPIGELEIRTISSTYRIISINTAATLATSYLCITQKLWVTSS